MASAATLAIIGVVGSLVGTGVSVYSQVQQGKAAKATAKFNADTAKNEGIRKQLLARENIKRQREMNRRHLSTQRAQLAASGITLSGTPLAVLGETAASLELEILDLAFNTNQQVNKLNNQAKMELFEGKQAKKAANLKAGASLISGLGSAAEDISAGYQSGAFGAGTPTVV